MSARIDSIDFDSTTLPVDEQFDSWASHAPHVRLTKSVCGGFTAKGTLWDLSEAHVTRARLDSFTSERNQALIDRTEADHIHIVLLLKGSVCFNALDVNEVCVAPDAFVRNLNQPSRIAASSIDSITIYFARPFLEAASGAIIRQGRLPRSPELAIACDMINVLISNLAAASRASAGHYARTLRDVFAAAIIAGWGRTAGATEEAVGRVKEYIAAQPPGTLSTSAMTKDLGISRAALYRLFRSDGGLHAYDRQRRVRALYRALGETPSDQSIARIAVRFGFPDATVMARLFRRTFGCSPGEVRRRGAVVMDAGDGPASRIGKAIARLK